MAKSAKSTQKAGHAVSPLAPKSFPKLPPLAGVRLATAAAGVRYKDRKDVLLALLAPGTQVAGVFTTSKTASAPVRSPSGRKPNSEPSSRMANPCELIVLSSARLASST